MNFVEGSEAEKRDAASIGIRPEHIEVSKTEGEWRGKVKVAEHLGSDTFLHVAVDGIGTITARAGGEVGVAHNDDVHLTPLPDKIHRLGVDEAALV